MTIKMTKPVKPNALQTRKWNTVSKTRTKKSSNLRNIWSVVKCQTKTTILLSLLGLVAANAGSTPVTPEFDPAVCGSNGWMCDCEEEIVAICGESEDKTSIFNCLRGEVEAENEGINPVCNEKVSERAGLNVKRYPDECGKTGWKCTCEEDINTACGDIDAEDSGAVWECLTAHTKENGVSSKECQESVERRFNLLRQSQLAGKVQIPPPLLASYFKTTCHPTLGRIRNMAGPAPMQQCISLNGKAMKMSKCSLKEDQQFTLVDANSTFEYALVKLQDNEYSCLTAKEKSNEMDFAACTEKPPLFSIVPTRSHSLRFKSIKDNKCLTFVKGKTAKGKGKGKGKSTPSKLLLQKCITKPPKKAKSQEWSFDTVFNQSPAFSYDDAGLQLSASLSTIMSAILSEEISNMEKEMYDQMIDQMQFMLSEAGISLDEIDEPAPPAEAPDSPSPPSLEDNNPFASNDNDNNPFTG